MILPSFAYPTYAENLQGDIQSCINFFPVKTPEGWVLESCPGYDKIGNAGNGAVYRGHLFTSTSQVFAVFGNTVYELFADGATSSRGTISSSSGNVSMADNGTSLIVVPDGGTSYTVGLTSGAPTQITDVNFPAPPIGAAYLDGYFIVGNLSDNSFSVSELNSGSDWTPQTRAFANSSADNIVGLAVVGQRLFILGYRTIEPWYNTGNADFPFERVSGGILKIGVPSPRHYCIGDDSLFFISSADGGSGSAYILNAGGLRMVSPEHVTTIIRSLSIGTFRLFYQEYNGHRWFFVRSSSLAASRCMVFDMATDQWHERQSFNGSDYGTFTIAAGVAALSSGYYSLAFNETDDSIYEFGNSKSIANKRFADEDGVAIRRRRDFGPISSDIHKLFHRRMRVEAEARHADTANYTITATLQKSDDMGLTFDSGVSVSREVTSGTTAQRVVFDFPNLGMAENRVYRLTFTGPSAYITLRRCDLSIEKGRH